MAAISKYNAFLWPTLNAIKSRGGQATNEDIYPRVVAGMAFSPDQLGVLHKNGPQTEIQHRIGWARTALRIAGAIEPVSRKVWRVTTMGHGIGDEEELLRRYRDAINSARKQRLEETARARKQRLGIAPAKLSRQGRRMRRVRKGASPLQRPWQDVVLDHVNGLSAAQFGRLCQKLLRGAGFTSLDFADVDQTGNLVGYGTLRVGLIALSTMVQAGRSDSYLGPEAIHSFRGAMVGRADQGILITTGRFSDAAVKEAVRDGAPPVELVDGHQFCSMLRAQQLGVTKVETCAVQEDYFARL